jgi:hypothetical protein
VIWHRFRKWLGAPAADDIGEVSPEGGWPRSSEYLRNLADISRTEAAWKLFMDGLQVPRPAPYVEVWIFWRISRDGTPTASICDDPMGHPHTHLVRIPIPEDVQKCIAATKNPPLCMVLGKSGKMTGACPEPSNETETK